MGGVGGTGVSLGVPGQLSWMPVCTLVSLSMPAKMKRVAVSPTTSIHPLRGRSVGWGGCPWVRVGDVVCGLAQGFLVGWDGTSPRKYWTAG